MSVRPVTALALGGTMSKRPTTTGGDVNTLGKIQTVVADGNMTATVYAHIRDLRYDDAIGILSTQLEEFPRSRATLSLLGYCNYMKGDYEMAVAMYEQLTRLFPSVEEYTVYYAQALYKAGMYEESSQMSSLIESEQYASRLVKLQACVSYEQDQLPQTKAFLDKCHSEEPDVIVMQGCVLYKEGSYEKALELFQSAMNGLGFKPDLAYNIALCYYRMQQYGPSMKQIADIVDRGIHDHPELNVGSNTEGTDTRSVGNTPVLRESALIEAFNLKTAIEFMMKNLESAKEALLDMPPRLQEELDPVTLHNTAIVNMAVDPATGFLKLNHLVQNPPFPAETFQNLLLFFCKYQYYDRAADVLAENPDLISKYLTEANQPLYEFLDGTITAQTSPEHAFHKFDHLGRGHVETLRKLTKKIQDAKQSGDKEAAKASLKQCSDALEEYIPVLMAQAKIYWDREHYQMVENIFRQSAEFCSDHEVWKLNVAHVFFMQETKFREAIRYYEPVVKSNAENILNVSAMILANLCVSYIMTSLNDQAEDIMRRIEREEEKLMFSEPEKQPLHLCIVNLVIGTLYCSKGNFEFGISRIVKSLEPYNRKIMTDTWFYAKRCFLALAMSMAKQMTIIKDESMKEILEFLDQADRHGEKIPAVIHPDPSQQDTTSKNTVRYEARQLKSLYLKLRAI